jgi:hypothetical protein
MTWKWHNRIIHPIRDLARFFGFRKWAQKFHDSHMPDEIEAILWDLDGMAGTIDGAKSAKGK